MSPLRRPVLHLRVAHRFAVVLAGLLLVMAALAVVATSGVQRVNARVSEIDRGELRTTQRVSRLALQLADTEQTVLRLIATGNVADQAELNTRWTATASRWKLRSTRFALPW
jgi:hypothetical protein